MTSATSDLSTGLGRLKRLVVVLEGVKADPAKAKEFDLRSWAVTTPDCGTHCCAVGWGAQDQELKDQGLGLAWRKDWRNYPIATPTFDGETEARAVARFFDLGNMAVDWLFMPHKYYGDRSIDAVITRIKEHISLAETEGAV